MLRTREACSGLPGPSLLTAPTQLYSGNVLHEAARRMEELQDGYECCKQTKFYTWLDDRSNELKAALVTHRRHARIPASQGSALAWRGVLRQGSLGAAKTNDSNHGPKLVGGLSWRQLSSLSLHILLSLCVLISLGLVCVLWRFPDS